MKINFRNKAAKLKLSRLVPACVRCPFYESVPCPFGTLTIVDCCAGWWIDRESLDIFRV